MPPTNSIKKDKKLWKSIKDKWIRSSKGGRRGQTSARKMQLATKEYQRRGGRYLSGVKRKDTSLYNWSQPRKSSKKSSKKTRPMRSRKPRKSMKQSK